MRRLWSFGLLFALAGCVSTAHGRDRIEASSGRIGTYTYSDVLKPHGRARGEPEEQVATRLCDGGNWRRIGRPEFDACMRAQGWRLANFKPAPSSPPDDSYSPSPSVDSTPTPSGPDMAQQTADLNASMAAAQAQNDAANAATVQTEYQFNTIYSNPNQ